MKFRIFNIILFFMIYHQALQAFALTNQTQTECSTLFISNQEPQLNPTENSILSSSNKEITNTSILNFISYFQFLLEQNILTANDLEKLLNSLNENKFINPIPHELTELGPIFTKTAHQIHFEAFEKAIHNPSIDLELIKKWATDKLNKKSEDSQKRHEVQKHTQYTYQKMEFIKIESGYFKRFFQQTFHEIQITKPFEMMSTPVTQFMWASLQILFGEKKANIINPSIFKAGVESTKINLNGNEVKLRPDNPVENISYPDVYNFLRKLNQLSNSKDEYMQDLLITLIPDHKKGDFYRLPTEAEWEYVSKARGIYSEESFFREKESELHDYIWFNENANDHTHPVGQKLPLLFDNKEFFDLAGNVWEMTDTFYSQIPYAGTDPKGPEEGIEKVILGGSFESGVYATMDLTRTRWQASANYKERMTGFRLVREKR